MQRKVARPWSSRCTSPRQLEWVRMVPQIRTGRRAAMEIRSTTPAAAVPKANKAHVHQANTG
jgi:hypothetical protein